MTRISWSPRARRQFTLAVAYLADSNPDAAHRMAVRVAEQTRLLADFPAIGTPLPGGDRKLTVRGFPYTLRYQSTDSGVEIIAFRHMARAVP